MKRLFGSFIDIRKGEAGLVSLMFAYYYLILVTIYFLKPTRDSLFLVRLGAEQLPLVFVLIALIVLPVTTSYARLSRSLSLTRLINVTTAILVVNLLILRGLIGLDQNWVYYVFYIWVSIYGVLSTSQFWLFAGTVFNPAQAKRLFPLLNIGGILGAVTGGEVTSFIVQTVRVPTENLLFFCMGFLLVCIILLNIMWKIKEKEGEELPPPLSYEEQRRDSVRDMVGTIRRSRSLEFIVGIIAFMVMVNTFVDFQFKSISVATFPEKADLTAFMGKFYGRIGLIPLFIQVFLSSRLLRTLGVGGAILLLPGSLMLGSAALFIAPSLLTGIFLRGADQSFRYSLNKTGLELLFLPVPMELKKRTKVFIDVFIDQVAQGLSGALLLLCTLVLGLSIRSLSLVTIALAGVWMFLAIRAYAEYVNAFRKALERREIDLDELNMNIGDTSSVQTLVNTLQSDNERQLVYALDMLASAQAVDLLPPIRPLLAHRSAEIRQKALQVLRSSTSSIPTEEIESLLHDDDQEVRIATMALLCDQTPDPIPLLKRYLEYPDLRIQSAAIVCIAENSQIETQHLISEEVIRNLLNRDGEEAELLRVQVARALGMLNTPELQPYLLQLTDDPSPVVARSAIESAGMTRNPQMIPLLLQKLADHTYRASARQAFVTFGAGALNHLNQALIDDTMDPGIRRNIPRVLRRIPIQESVDILLTALDSGTPAFQYPIVKALNKLRKYPTLRIDDTLVNAALIEEARVYYEMVTMAHLPWEETPAVALLRRSFSDKQHQSLELIFRLLGLQYPPQDIYNAYEGIVSRNTTLRASAIEFLDNVLRQDIKRYLFPILDQVSVEFTIQQGRELFGHRMDAIDQALIHLIRGRDTWLRACAMVVMTGTEPPDVIHLVEQARNDPAPLIRETASMVLVKIRDTEEPRGQSPESEV